jgi:hypothetical protein
MVLSNFRILTKDGQLSMGLGFERTLQDIVKGNIKLRDFGKSD